MQPLLITNCTPLYLNFLFDLLTAAGGWVGGHGGLAGCCSAMLRMHCAADTWQSSHSLRLWFLPKFNCILFNCRPARLHNTVIVRKTTHMLCFMCYNNNMGVMHSDLKVYHLECVRYGCFNIFNVRSLNWRIQRSLSRAVPLGHTPGSVQAQHTVSGHFTGLWEFPQVHCKIASPSIRQFP